MTTTMRPAYWMAIGAVLGMLLTSTLLDAQGLGAQPGPGPDAGALMGKVFSGDEIGLAVRGRNRESLLVVPMIKVDGAWVEVGMGVPGIRKASQ
ncbi:MAG: hypothetical protein R2745_00445 [Vicinamibacterales bacterium]